MLSIVIAISLFFLSLKKLFDAYVENTIKAFPEGKAIPVFVDHRKLLWDYKKLSIMQRRLCRTMCYFAIVTRDGNCMKFYTSCTIKNDDVFFKDKDAITIVSPRWMLFASKYLKTF